jgi:hypothetical protein
MMIGSDKDTIGFRGKQGHKNSSINPLTNYSHLKFMNNSRESINPSETIASNNLQSRTTSAA